MKYTLYPTLLLTGLLVLHSCQDFLDEPIRGTQEVNNYFQNETECEKYIFGCYQSILQGEQYWYINWYYVLTESATDDSWLGQPVESDTHYKDFSRIVVNSHNTWLYPFWEYMYKSIYQSNLALEGLDRSPVKESNPELIARLSAEARFLRAYAHFELAKNWENLPIMDHVFSPEELISVELSTQAQVYEQIIKDLLDAAAVLPESVDADNRGRITRWTVQAYLAKAYMYAEQWENAYELSNDVIESGTYKLEPRFGDIWDVKNPNGMESIFEFQTNYDPNFDTGNSFPILTGASLDDGGWYYTNPSSHLENEFLAQDDTIRLRATIIKATNEATAETDNKAIGPVYDTDGISIAVAAQGISDLDESKSMRVNRKFYILPDDRNDKYGTQNRRKIPKNHILMRLAELKLIRAEAMWQMIHTVGGATFSEGDIVSGDIHDIRARVGLPDISSTGNQLLLDIYRERRMELAMEFKRWDEMRRAKHPDSGLPMIYHIMGPQGSFVMYNTQENTDYWEKFSPFAESEPSDKGIDFEPGSEWMPVPARDMSWLQQ